MRRSRSAVIAALASLAVMTASLTCTFAADAVSVDRLLPSNTPLYISIPSVPELGDRWQSTLLGQMAHDEQFAPFLQQFEDKLNEVSTEAEQKLGVTLSSLMELPAGELAIAVLRAGGKFGFLAVADIGENRETLDTLLKKGHDAAQEKGSEITTEEIDGETVTIISVANQNDDPSQPPQNSRNQENQQRVMYVVKDSRLLIANDTKVLSQVFARWDGQHNDTFAGNDVYAYMMSKCAPDEKQPAAKWFVNPIALIGAIAAENTQAQMALGFLPSLGLNKLKAIGGAVDLATDEFDSVNRTMVYVDQPTTGVLSVFNFPPAQLAPPTWVSESANSYFAMNWDASKAYSAVSSLIDSFQGPGTFSRMVEQIAKQPNGPQVHIRKDFTDQLAGQIHVVTDLADPTMVESQRVLTAMDLKDPAAMKATMAKLAAFPGMSADEREFLGNVIYELSPALTGQSKTMGVAVNTGHLMIASDVTLLESVIRADREQRPLADSADYRRVAAKFPTECSMIGYSRQSEQFRALYEMARNSPPGQFVEGVDFGLLPSFESVQKYLQPSGSYGVPDENGALLVNFQLKSEQ